MDPPQFAAPRKQNSSYIVDATAVVHPGEPYHVAAISFDGVPADMDGEVAKASGLKDGDIAGEMTLRIAEGLAARAMENHGLLDASAKAEVEKNAAARTVAYHFAVVPGPVYTFAGLDTSALPADLQSRFQSEFHGRPGVIADAALRNEILRVLRSGGANGINIVSKRNVEAHSVVYVLMQRSAAVRSVDDAG